MSWIQEVREKTSSAPRTSLGFYAGICAIVFTGTAVLAGTLSKSGAPEWLVAVVVCVGLFVLVAVVGAVIALNVLSPEKLMLGQLSGSEFSTITRERSQLGDSRTKSLLVAEVDGSGADLDVEDAVIVEDSSEPEPPGPEVEPK